MSSFFIHDKNRVRIGVLQNEESVQWLDSFKSPGEVKIVARITTLNFALLVVGNRIYNTDTKTSARIEHVDINEDRSQQEMTVRAVLTAKTLDNRVVMATETITNVEAGMYGLFSRNLRGLPLLAAEPEGFPDVTETQISWGSVLEAIRTLSEASDLGFTVMFNPETTEETFKVYKGIDRSIVGNPNYVGYFGVDADNIYDISISSGISKYKNVAVVAGEGEGADRVVRIVSLFNVSGEERRELFVDARDLQSTVQIATDTGTVDEHGNPIFEYEDKTYTATEYNALLDNRGLEKLAENLADFNIVCSVDQTNLEYNRDYFLGDRMPVELKYYGLRASAVVSSVNLIYEQSGIRPVVTLTDFRLEDQNALFST